VTVRELIEKLKDCDPDAEVLIPRPHRYDGGPELFDDGTFTPSYYLATLDRFDYTPDVGPSVILTHGSKREAQGGL
jgi:hypothetical protein